jgi:hypothetical protein
MTVRPTPSGQNPSIGINRAQRPGVGSTPQRQGDARSSAAHEARRDDVQISSQARELQQVGAPVPQAPEISSGRMKQVLDRMSVGHYDRPDVQREVVRRLLEDL